MPLKLVPPKEGRSKVYRVRGTHRGVPLDRSTGIAADEKRAEARAKAFLERWRDQIERGELTGKKPLTFLAASVAFGEAGGDMRFAGPVVAHFGPRLAAQDVDQHAVDEAAVKLYPHGTPATRARQVYAPISAILRHNGLGFDMKRPKGSQGNRREIWLRPEEFERVAAQAFKIDQQLGTMMVLACYTGMRLGEILGARWRDVDMAAGTLTIERTKNGDPRVVHLPPRVIASLQNLVKKDAENKALKVNKVLSRARRLSTAASTPDQESRRLFRFTRNGRLNAMARLAYERAGVDPGDAPWHCLRHTWATWMVRIGVDLVATKAWRSATSARGYTHFVVSEEARKADALPGAGMKEIG